MHAKDIAKAAGGILTERLTDEIFLIIQRDRTLMQAYLAEIAARGVNAVNSEIGKEVKNLFGLLATGTRNDEPQATVIQSHEILQFK